ncbi:MAG: hypothetical protein RH860_13755 [Cytophagales bacterium]
MRIKKNPVFTFFCPKLFGRPIRNPLTYSGQARPIGMALEALRVPCRPDPGFVPRVGGKSSLPIEAWARMDPEY